MKGPPRGALAASDGAADRTDDLETGKVLLIVRHPDAPVRNSDSGNDHIEPAGRPQSQVQRP
ncbi:hypothetical protein [Rhizobium chutanense]|uniref:hypothetical protein n=1 Tax=Rhizobium chutanense TaxID=2035448 RepID=UPI0015CF7673